MKNSIQLILFTLLVVFLNACTSTETTQQNQAEITEVITCPIDTISVSEGETMISEAQTYIDTVNEGLDAGAVKIPYGAKIPVCEMKEILNKLGNTPETWAMMAMENGELTIIFQGKEEETDKYVYYDFTQPCPNKCPDQN